MRVGALLCLALSIASGATAASPGFLLGVDYSEWLAPYVTQISADSSGALYMLSSPPSSGGVVTKLAADGKTIAWQNNLGFAASAMAVDPNGGVYVTPVSDPGGPPIYVAKLGPNGTGLAWQMPVGFIPPGYGSVLAADGQGRAYVAGLIDLVSEQGGVVRLNAAGSAIDYTAQIAGWPTSIGVDRTGAAFVAGDRFLARLAPDGSPGFYSTAVPGGTAAIGVDSSGDAVLYNITGTLLGFDSTGTAKFTKTTMAYGALAVDAAGNAYVAGGPLEGLYPVAGSLATCGSALLSVFAPDGSILQTTYLPGATRGAFVAVAPNSTVFVVAYAPASFAPTQAGPFAAATSESAVLFRLSPNPNAQTLPLVCLGNAASYGTGPIAPGEIVTLVGNGLGPQQGLQTSPDSTTAFPTQAAGVEVTFDGRPAPLLWVQDSQINAVAPWSLTPGQSTQVCVTYSNVKTNCLAWPVVQAAPAAFTVDGVHAAALNQDGSINSADNPAALNSIVSVFATGLGPIVPAQADGTLVELPLPDDVLPVGIEAQWRNPLYMFSTAATTAQLVVTYAGPAPYMIAGASQINFQIVYYYPGPPLDGAIYVNMPYATSPGFQVYISD
jgi:uncharacterized protein (TIGR03437 family)